MEFTGERFIPNCGVSEALEIEHLQRYYSILDLVKGSIVLDAACGEGYGTALMANYAKYVYGIDIDQETIQHASNKYKKINKQFLNASIVSIPLKANSIDVVVSFETIEHVDENAQHTFLKEVKRVLKKDGILVISTPDKLIYSDLPKNVNKFHVKEFYKNEFEDFLKGYFPYVEIYTQKQQITHVLNNSNYNSSQILPIDKGTDHTGPYLIAVCGNMKINQNINSIVLDEKNNYENLMKKISMIYGISEKRHAIINELQNKIEQQNQLIKELNYTINVRDNRINELQNVLNHNNKKE